MMHRWKSGINGSAVPARCFVPEILINRVLKQFHHFGTTDIEPSSFFFHGACLLVDISGFTRLSGEFCAQGKNGIDDLQLATNGFMGKLVEIIYECGGDIVKFAGDAIICIFSAELHVSASSRIPSCASVTEQQYTNEHIEIFSSSQEFSTSIDVVLRAMNCAQILRNVQNERLSVHVAMSCGEMCFGILGGYENRWECLISGTCLEELSDCLDDAGSKQAVLSHSCVKILYKSLPNSINLSKNPTLHMSESFTYETDTGTYQFLLEALSSKNQRIINVNYTSNSKKYDSSEPMPELIASLLQASAELDEPPSSPGGLKPEDKRILQRLVRPFIPVPVLVAEEASSTNAGLAEIREVTTMFMKVSSDGCSSSSSSRCYVVVILLVVYGRVYMYSIIFTIYLYCILYLYFISIIMLYIVLISIYTPLVDYY